MPLLISRISRSVGRRVLVLDDRGDAAAVLANDAAVAVGRRRRPRSARSRPPGAPGASRPALRACPRGAAARRPTAAPPCRVAPAQQRLRLQQRVAGAELRLLQCKAQAQPFRERRLDLIRLVADDDDGRRRAERVGRAQDVFDEGQAARPDAALWEPRTSSACPCRRRGRRRGCRTLAWQP